MCCQKVSNKPAYNPPPDNHNSPIKKIKNKNKKQRKAKEKFIKEENYESIQRMDEASFKNKTDSKLTNKNNVTYN